MTLTHDATVCLQFVIVLFPDHTHLLFINNSNILKTWYRNFVSPADMHYHRCVSSSVQIAFQTYLRAPNTDYSTFTMGRVHYSQLISVGEF